ncbi:MAG TPA: DUF167 domain-containing protein [Nitrospirota bacterium]
MQLTTKESPDGVSFSVKVLPRSSRSEIVGEAEGVLRVKLTAPPVEGAANKALVELLAKKLGVSKSSVEIISGETSKNKLVRVSNLTASELTTKLG